MKHLTSQAIVLSRTNFGEADRIVTLLTPDQGKISVLARGVRKTKSKLAGGIELFSVSDVSYIVGRGEVYTLTSSRLAKHYGHIAKDLDRTSAAYDFIKLIHRNTEASPEHGYFNLLQNAFGTLDDLAVDPDLTRLWFNAQLLKLAGHTPNLQTDEHGGKLAETKSYSFDFDAMSFRPDSRGKLLPNHIKFMRLLFGDASVDQLQKIDAIDALVKQTQLLMNSMVQLQLRS